MFLKTSFVALALFAASPVAMAAESLVSDREINGHSISEIEANLKAKGIDVTGIEKWGDALRAHAQSASGEVYWLFVDQHTFRTLEAAPAVATSLDVGTTSGAVRTAPSSSQAPLSLSQNSDE
ncbi:MULTISPECIES: hypothetical protein [unclassified Devosia]|uniref:hypothetical protein n=1 Tax=unclassified Devosia TaxID=196773 RepID=UPI0015546732|nr:MULTISPECIES: hypothetical protein [unclassified Devosia]